MLDFLGHTAYLLIAIGMALLGKGDPRGFLSQAAGAFIWIIIAFFMPEDSPYIPIIIWNVIFGLIGVRGYYRMRAR